MKAQAEAKTAKTNPNLFQCAFAKTRKNRPLVSGPEASSELTTQKTPKRPLVSDPGAGSSGEVTKKATKRPLVSDPGAGSSGVITKKARTDFSINPKPVSMRLSRSRVVKQTATSISTDRTTRSSSKAGENSRSRSPIRPPQNLDENDSESDLDFAYDSDEVLTIRSVSLSCTRVKTRKKREVDMSEVDHPFFARTSKATPLDEKIVLDPKDSDRLQWRTENYSGPKPRPSGLRQNVLTDENFFLNLQDDGIMTFTCPECDGEAKLRIDDNRRSVGRRFFEVRCSECNHKFQDIPKKNENSDILKGYPVHVLKSMFNCLRGQVSHETFRAICASNGLKSLSKDSFYDIITLIYHENNALFEELIKHNRNEVIKFYKKHKDKTVYQKGKYNICVSCDGSYTKRSYLNIYDSRFVISFIVESYTGLIIDCVCIEKCISPDCKPHLPDFNKTDCPNNKFHGSSKSLEVSAAITLFRNSEREGYPFRYLTYVGDGDSNVWFHLSDEIFYNGEFTIKKEECVYHYRKSFRTKLCDALNNTSILEVKADAARKKTFKNLNKDDWKTVYPYRKYHKTWHHRFSNLFMIILFKAIKNIRKADQMVITNPKDLKYISDAIRAIPGHYCDHKNSTYAQREVYHVLCNRAFCDYKAINSISQKRIYRPKKDGEFYVREVDGVGNLVTTAMDSIQAVFDKFGSIENISRCTRLLNQNANESIHARCYNIITKGKCLDFPHTNFAMQLTAMIHNNGYVNSRGAMLKRLGEYLPEEHAALVLKDKERMVMASEKHRAAKIRSRWQLKDPLNDKFANYRPGFAFENHPPEGVLEYSENQKGRQPFRPDEKE